MSADYRVEVRFHRPPPDLQRYFTTFYYVDMFVDGGGRVADYLHPEWANLRFYAGTGPEAARGDRLLLRETSFAVTGPSSQAMRFSMGSSRMWGIGLLPAGWARFIRARACDYANAAIDGYRDPVFASFRGLADRIRDGQPDEAAELASIVSHFRQALAAVETDEDRIAAIHAALVDIEIDTVGALVARAGVTQRTVERICDRAFGFRPKVLLRRQRFMRSLAQYMLDPSLKWIGAIDSHYHDQAQFVRDFRDFMGMTPSDYAALDKPIVGAVLHERARYALAAVQTLDGPGGTEVAEPG